MRPARRQARSDRRYVADPILSCSGCLLDGAAGPEASWSSSFDETAGHLRVAPDDVPRARTWVAERDHDVGWLTTWTSPVTLLEFVERFIPDGSATVLGVALNAGHARRWLGEERPNDAIATMLARGAPPEPGGVPLGWEPVEWLTQGVACSWTCNSLQPLVAEQIELRLTPDGLLPDQRFSREFLDDVHDLVGVGRSCSSGRRPSRVYPRAAANSVGQVQRVCAGAGARTTTTRRFRGGRLVGPKLPSPRPLGWFDPFDRRDPVD